MIKIITSSITNHFIIEYETDVQERQNRIEWKTQKNRRVVRVKNTNKRRTS